MIKSDYLIQKYKKNTNKAHKFIQAAGFMDFTNCAVSFCSLTLYSYKLAACKEQNYSFSMALQKA